MKVKLKGNNWLIGSACLILCMAVVIFFYGALCYGRTILPFRISPIYYDTSIIIIPVVYALTYKLFYNNKSLDDLLGISFVVLMTTYFTIFTLIFIPNSLLPIDESKTYMGKVVDSETIGGSKSKRYIIQIKLDDENSKFWYKADNYEISNGTICIIKARTGLFGMRYAEEISY